MQLGKNIARERKYRGLGIGTVSAVPLDASLLVDDHIEPVGDLPIEQNLTRNEKDAAAKEQRLRHRNDAMRDWDDKLKNDEKLRVASGFKAKGKKADDAKGEVDKGKPWHIKEGIERGNIKGEESRLNETLDQFYQDFNDVVDAFGYSLDNTIQRDDAGKVIFIGSMTYDRKQRGITREDGQEESGSEDRVRVRTATRIVKAEDKASDRAKRIKRLDGTGYDKVVRTVITTPGFVDNAGYNAARGDLLLAERMADTKLRMEEVAVFVGPLLPELKKAVFENATATEIGESLGYVKPQASAVGNAFLQRALEAAGDAYDRIKKRDRDGLSYTQWLDRQPDGMPVPARKAKRAYVADNDNCRPLKVAA
jgi:hypothetical protein